MKYAAPTKHNPAHRKSSFNGCRIYNMANGANTANVTTSCTTFNCARLNVVCPIRLAGTWSMYSKNAIPQLNNAAMYHFRSFQFRKWAYHAKVMNVFEQINNTTVRERMGKFIAALYRTRPAPQIACLQLRREGAC